MNRPSRRNFLKSSLFAGATLSWNARSWANVAGANSDVRVAVVGFGGRGGDHIGAYSAMHKEGKGARLVALCDVDSKILAGGVEKVSKDLGSPVKGYQDIRKLLESKEIDAISVATPNHWHALATIWAVQAGCDVYVEKPVSHNVWEGRKMVEAARKYNKMVQTGTQSRSSRKGIAQAIEWVKAGNLGKITLARGLCYKPRPSLGKVAGPQEVPESVDYDLWCGPAEKLPLTRKKLHYDWHWAWNTGNGDLGNQGIHQMDICRWFLGENALAPKVLSVGGRLGYVDDGETPNTMIIFQEYAAAPLLFEVRGLGTEKYMDAAVGCIIHCEGGHVLVPNYNGATAFDKAGKEIKKWDGSENHYANFIAAVHSRKQEDLHADILEGHLSSALCHTGNISHRLGTLRKQGEIQEEIKGNPAMSESLGRMVDHLGKNKVDLEATQLTAGVPLQMDPKTERFTNHDTANDWLTRKYRAPFVVPEQV